MSELKTATVQPSIRAPASKTAGFLDQTWAWYARHFWTGFCYMNQGLKVTAVAADGLGKQMGLKENDVLVSVNGTKTATSKDLREALARVNKDVEIVLLRGGARQTVKGTLKSSSRGEGRYVFMPEKR